MLTVLDIAALGYKLEAYSSLIGTVAWGKISGIFTGGVTLRSKKSGNVFRAGIFLDFVRLTTRTPHGAYVRRAKRKRIDPHWDGIARLSDAAWTGFSKWSIIVQRVTGRFIKNQVGRWS